MNGYSIVTNTRYALIYNKRMIRETVLYETAFFSMIRNYEQAFLEAFDEHAGALFRHACFRLKRRDRATDITQDTFIKAWDYVRGGGEITHWKAFLYRVLHNLIIDEYRSVKEVSLDALAETNEVRAEQLLKTGGKNEIESHLNDQMLLEQIRTHIDALPETYRTAITLRYLEGFTPKEIAQVLEVSENVVSVRIHRGVAQLKKLCAPTTL